MAGGRKKILEICARVCRTEQDVEVRERGSRVAIRYHVTVVKRRALAAPSTNRALSRARLHDSPYNAFR
jgi:hypothetical protein